MRDDLTRSASMAGAVASALAASACCVGPLLFAMLGLGGAGFLVALEPYRPIFTAFTVLLLGLGFTVTYRRPKVDDCACELPRGNHVGRWMLWVAAGVSGVALIFPSLVPYLF